MKALHTLDTTTLLMNTMLLISSGKYHSYFILSPLFSGSNSETPTLQPAGVGWMESVSQEITGSPTQS